MYPFRTYGTKRVNLIRELSQSATVYISSEERLDEEFQPFEINIHPWEIHHVLANASLLISEGATMASEGAILGTPTIYINSLKAGTIEEQCFKYGLISSFRDEDGILKKAIELTKNDSIKNEWIKKREKLISEKSDVTELILSSVSLVSSWLFEI